MADARAGRASPSRLPYANSCATAYSGPHAPSLVHPAFLPPRSLAHRATDPSYFAQSVYPVFSKAGFCPGCHNPDGGSLRHAPSHFHEPDAPPAAIEAFGKSLHSLGDLLLNKPTRRVAHAGGLRIPPGTPKKQPSKPGSPTLNTLPAPDAPRAAPREACAPGTLRPGASPAHPRPVQQHRARPPRRRHVPHRRPVSSRRFRQRLQRPVPEPRASRPLLLAEAYSASAAEKLAANAFRAGDIRHTSSLHPLGVARHRLLPATNSSMISDAAPSRRSARCAPPNFTALHSPFHLRGRLLPAAASFPPAPRSSSKPCSNPRPSSRPRGRWPRPRVARLSKPRHAYLTSLWNTMPRRRPPAGCRRGGRPRHRSGGRTRRAPPHARRPARPLTLSMSSSPSGCAFRPRRRHGQRSPHLPHSSTPELAIANMAERNPPPRRRPRLEQRQLHEAVLRRLHFRRLPILRRALQCARPRRRMGTRRSTRIGWTRRHPTARLSSSPPPASRKRPRSTTRAACSSANSFFLPGSAAPSSSASTPISRRSAKDHAQNQSRTPRHPSGQRQLQKAATRSSDPVGFWLREIPTPSGSTLGDKLTVTFLPRTWRENREAHHRYELPLDSTGFVARHPRLCFRHPA